MCALLKVQLPTPGLNECSSRSTGEHGCKQLGQAKGVVSSGVGAEALRTVDDDLFEDNE